MLRPTSWPCPTSGDEYAIVGDQTRAVRLLILPALFDEANRMRHFTVEVMRHLDAAGIDTFLPDFAGCNESCAPIGTHTLSNWREQARAAAQHFGATHLLTLRAGAMLDFSDLPTIRYAPVATSSVLRSLLRARAIAEREAGREVSRDSLLEEGRLKGLSLAGYQLSAQMIAEMQDSTPSETSSLDIAQSDVGGAGLWLRAEPGHDPEQAESLAKRIADHLA